MPLLKVEHIFKIAAGSLLLDDVSFIQETGQKIAIAGESGAGKTTLLKMIAGHGQADKGQVIFNDEKVLGIEEKLLAGHKNIGYLSQHYEIHNNYFVEDLLWFENTLSKQHATELFKICKVFHLLKRKSQTLSGGEKQRVALCMLLIKQPKLLVLDEPFSNLDLINSQTLKTVLESLTQKLNITILLSSHQPGDTLYWADSIIVLQNGKILQQASPREIYYRPVNQYVAGLFGRFNLLNTEEINALFNTRYNHQSNKKIMLRPNCISVEPNQKTTAKAIVKQVHFYGSFVELIVSVEEILLIVHSFNQQIKTGDFINLNVDINNLWFMQI